MSWEVAGAGFAHFTAPAAASPGVLSTSVPGVAVYHSRGKENKPVGNFTIE